MLRTAELAHRFQHHPSSNPSIIAAHESVRELLGFAAEQLDELLPNGREKSLTMTRIEEAMMWANAAIARTQEVGR